MSGAIRSDELLTTAAFRGEVERVRAMLDHGASTTARSAQTMCTALHWAVSMGHIEVAEVCTAQASACPIRVSCLS
jgi:ankyrin repeat protein